MRLLLDLQLAEASAGDVAPDRKDDALGSEVEVKFIADGANATRVELEHRKFEQMGAEAGESMRKDVDRGWPGLLEMFKRRAETA